VVGRLVEQNRSGSARGRVRAGHADATRPTGRSPSHRAVDRVIPEPFSIFCSRRHRPAPRAGVAASPTGRALRAPHSLLRRWWRGDKQKRNRARRRGPRRHSQVPTCRRRAGRPARGGRPADSESARRCRIDRNFSGDDTEERRFPAAVPPHQAHAFGAVDLQVDAIEERKVSVRKRHLFERQERHSARIITRV
jgi:hypothetical protein